MQIFIKDFKIGEFSQALILKLGFAIHSWSISNAKLLVSAYFSRINIVYRNVDRSTKRHVGLKAVLILAASLIASD